MLVRSIESSGVVGAVRERSCAGTTWTPQRFDEAHGEWCSTVLAMLQRHGVKDATFGRAAKLIAVYLKSTVVLGADHNSELRRIAHPPIDDILLRALAADTRFDAERRRLWRNTRWTRLDRVAYGMVIESFRVEGLEQPEFWMIERYWVH